MPPVNHTDIKALSLVQSTTH